MHANSPLSNNTAQAENLGSNFAQTPKQGDGLEKKFVPTEFTDVEG